MDDLNDKLTGGSLAATEWNQVPSELQNVIEGLGQVLNSGDLNQLGKSVAGYVANGNYYTDSGVANAYVLTQIGSKQRAPAFADGILATFTVGTTNTGASTVNWATLGTKNIYLDGAALTGGEMVAGQEITIRYNLSGDRADIVKSTLKIQDWIDGVGAADDKRLRLIVDGGIAKFLSLNDDLSTLQDSIIVFDLGTGNVGINGAPAAGEAWAFKGSSGNIAINSAGDTLSFSLDGVNYISVPGAAAYLHLRARGADVLKAGLGIQIGTPTGTDKGAGTVNVQNGIYSDNVLLDPGTDVTGFYKAQVTNIENDAGADTSTFDIAAAIGATYESVGPTGSGATNIWAALDAVPLTAKYVKLKLTIGAIGSTNGQLYEVVVKARKTGSAASGDPTAISGVSLYNRSGLPEIVTDYSTAEIPIDSAGRFDIQMVTGGSGLTAIAKMYLIGWGE